MASSSNGQRPRVSQLAQTTGDIVTGAKFPLDLVPKTRTPEPCNDGPSDRLCIRVSLDILLMMWSWQMFPSLTWTLMFRITKVSHGQFQRTSAASNTDFRRPGRTLVNRLQLIASTSTVLAVDALKLAVHDILRNGKDVQRYRAICDDLQALAPTDPDGKIDKQWIEQTDKANQAEYHRLESELKGYKNNLIKESIRVRTITE